MRIKKRNILKFSLLIISISIFVALVMYLLPLMKDILTYEGRVKFKEEISRFGIFSGGILFLLELAQIFLVVLPGEPLEVLAGMFYGGVGGSIFIFVTVFITTIFIYYIVKKFGRKILYEFFKKEKVDKILNSKIFRNERKVEMIMIILFMLPCTPKDLFVYLGGLLPISGVKFVLISTFARFPSVISSTIAGSSITNGNFVVTIVAYVISFIIAFILLFFINKLDKENVTKEAIKLVK